MTYEPVEIIAGGATFVGERWNGAGATIVLLHAGVCDRRFGRANRCSPTQTLARMTGEGSMTRRQLSEALGVETALV